MLLLALAFAGCKRKQKPEEHYQVMSFNARSHEWTLLYTSTYSGKPLKRRLILVCQFYKLGHQKPIDGPDACELDVGRVMVNNITPKNPDEALDVFQISGETLVVIQGAGDKEVSQDFSIIKDEVISQ